MYDVGEACLCCAHLELMEPTIDSIPGPVCLPVKFSSANLAPYILKHPVPSPCMAKPTLAGWVLIGVKTAAQPS